MSSTSNNEELTTAVLNVIIPPVADLAGAGSLGFEAELKRMSSEHHKFQGVLSEMVNAIRVALATNSPSSDQLTAAISSIESTDSQKFALFLELVYLAYYSDPRVHQRIGWKTGPLQPDGHPLPPWDESILDTVKQRKPFWTQVD